MQDTVSMIFDTLSEHAREAVTEMVNGGIGAGCPISCPKEALIDVTTGAVEASLRTLKEHSLRAAREGDGTDMIAMILAMNYLKSVFGTAQSVFLENAMRNLVR